MWGGVANAHWKKLKTMIEAGLVNVRQANLTNGTDTETVENIVLAATGNNGFVRAAELTGKVEIISGTIRQSAADRTQWNWINDANHEPIGVDDSAPCVATGSIISVPLSKTYNRVIGVVCGADETLSNGLNMTVGASVGLDVLELKASVSLSMCASVHYNGATWVVSYGPGQGGTSDHNVNISSAVFSGGSLTLTHDFMPGYDIAVAANARNGALGALVPYVPIVYSTTQNHGASYTTVIRFIDTAGAYVAAEDTKMSFIISKRYSEGIYLDGQYGTDIFDLDEGNIWFVGLMEV